MKLFNNILLLTHDVRDLDVTLARALSLAEENGAWLTILKCSWATPPSGCSSGSAAQSWRSSRPTSSAP